MKETNNPLNGKDYGFTKPWNTPVDITQPGAEEKIKQLGAESKNLMKKEPWENWWSGRSGTYYYNKEGNLISKDEYEALLKENSLEKKLEQMTNEEFAQYCFELRLALYEEELRRFGENK